MKWIILFAFVGLSALFSSHFKSVKAVESNSWKIDQSGDCAVVLTGSPGRLREGFDLLAQRSIRKLIISGVHPQAKLREIFPQWPYYGDLKEEDVILEKRSQTTYGNAQQTLPILEALKCKDMILITSELHAYRAYRTFRAVIPSEIPIIERRTPSTSVQFDDLAIESFKSLFYSFWAY